MNATTSLKLFELTRIFIKDKEKAKTFVEKIEANVDDKMEQRHQHLATKSDLAGLKVELMGVINDQKIELKEDIASLQPDLTKSIYLVGLVQFLAIVASVLAFFLLHRRPLPCD